METFTALDSSCYDITIILQGANDAPSISVEEGNRDRAELVENDSGLSLSGTLSVEDIDLADAVTVSVMAVEIDSTASSAFARVMPAGLGSALLPMLTVDDESVIGSTATTGTINWTFDSGSEAFDFLASGETLTLVYTITAIDNICVAGNDSYSRAVYITVTGSNDAPLLNAKGVQVKSDFVREIQFVTADSPGAREPVALMLTGATNLFDIDSDAFEKIELKIASASVQNGMSEKNHCQEWRGVD